jgi:hypothetical protein
MLRVSVGLRPANQAATPPISGVNISQVRSIARLWISSD